MRWYSIIKKASKPPAYIVERLSDLNHAIEVSETDPKEAIRIISNIITQLSAHYDKDFVPALEEASKIMLDSPKRAQGALKLIMKQMITEKEIMEDEKAEREANPWKKNTN